VNLPRGGFLIVVLLLSVPAPAVAANAGKHKPLRCRALKGRDAAPPGGKVKLVIRSTTNDADGEVDVMHGCVKPNGVVRKLAETADQGLGSSSVAVDAAHGTWISYTETGGNQYGGGSVTTVQDVRTGRGYDVFSNRYMLGDPMPDAFLDRLVFDARGRAATASGVPGGYDAATHQATNVTESMTVFTAAGGRVIVDDGPKAELPAESLSLAGDTVAWTHGGVPRSARFG
jgi:hypothetical protein